MDDFQPLRPHTLRQRLHAWLHREPVSPVPHWDTLAAPALPDFDVEAEWDRLLDYVRRLAAAGALDEAHGDLLDRDITYRAAVFRAQLSTAHARRQQILALPELQAREHLVTLGGKVRDLRSEFDNHSGRFEDAWTELSGTAPAALTSEPPIHARPTPATLDVHLPDHAPDEVGVAPPISEVPALHAVPGPEREQA